MRCSVVRVVVFCVLAIILVLKDGLMKVEETVFFLTRRAGSGAGVGIADRQSIVLVL